MALETKMQHRSWMYHAVLLATAVLAACASSDPDVDAVIQNLEQELSSSVVPALAEHGLAETTWDTFHEVLQDVRTEDLHVVRSSDAGGSGGSGQPDTLESVVTIVGPQRGACVAVSVSSDGTVKSLRVSGDPAANCEGAQVPDSSI